MPAALPCLTSLQPILYCQVHDTTATATALCCFPQKADVKDKKEDEADKKVCGGVVVCLRCL